MQTKQIEQVYTVLENISPEAKAVVFEQFMDRVIPAGEYLKQNECSGLLLILEGKLKIEKIDEEGRQTSLYEVGVGELCHENLACYLGCNSFNITGYALVDTKVVVIPKEVVRKYLIEEVSFLRYAYQALHSRLHYMLEHKESLVHESLEERIIHFLKEEERPIVYITHQALALELSSSREVISRKLKELEKQGKIELGRGKIKILGI